MGNGKEKEELIYPREIWVEGRKIDGAKYYDIDKLLVEQEVTHFVAAPGTGYIKYVITRIDEQGVWGKEVANTVRELTRREVE